MKEKKKNKGIKEFFRKLAVSLKQRPHNIALVSFLVTFIVYSFNLTKVSSTTTTINSNPMGLCSFITMLCSILAFVAFLNAFPKRQKPKVFMCIVLGVLVAAVIACDVVYLFKINQGITRTPEYLKNGDILVCQTMLIWHASLMGVSAALTLAIPLLRKLFGLINTSVDLGEEQEMAAIEVEDE